MSKEIARQEAIRLAIKQLKDVDISTCCPTLFLSPPEYGIGLVRAFGRTFALRQDDFHVLDAESGEPAKSNDRILVLHYLLTKEPVSPTDELISFRALPGGQFYWEPFLSRTVHPLVNRIGNDVNLLREHLNRFDWEEVAMGDLGARIHGIGKLDMTLVYHCGDDEFPPDADLLFDACIKQVFPTEDVAVFASRICLGLL